MDETILLPSPNWFLVSNWAVSKDGWIIYGGPRKSICVLEPINPEYSVISGNQSYKAHVVFRGHNEKVVSVDISPEFPEQKNFLSGSADGTVKQWTVEQIANTYKLSTTHAHDVHYNEKEEIIGVGYSTESVAITVGGFGNIVKWDLNSNVCKTYSKHLSNFKPTCMSCSPHISLNVAIGTKQGVIFVLDLTGDGKVIYKVRGQDDEITNLSWCPQYEVQVKKALKVFENRSSATARLEAIRNEIDEDILEQSGTVKKLPEDSFDESVVEEDDMFDIYKDHEANEFGHKKYEPENIVVKVKEEKNEVADYLAECLKLKEDILKRKNEGEPSIESLVEAMDKTHVNPAAGDNSGEDASGSGSQTENKEKTAVESSIHIHKHLLATIGKFGAVRIWSKSGKMMASCAVTHNKKSNQAKSIGWPTVLWYTPDTLLLVDGKSQLLECNPLQIDCKNKLEWRLVHGIHKRGLYAIASDAPRVQTSFYCKQSPHYHESNSWSVYTTSQDRNIVRYSIKEKKMLAIHNTCGGYVYNIHFCPYDASKIAISVGDGAVRVWQSCTEEDSLSPGAVRSYWQNVQGKVLTVAWHPTKENLLAFGTAESRVGLLDISGKSERPARVLCPALNGGVYSLCWGDDMRLYATGGELLVAYDAAVPDTVPKEIEVLVEGQRGSVSAATCTTRGLLCGTHAGALALLDPTTYQTQAVGYFYSKMIYMVEWHPIQVSSSSDESPYKHLIALCALDKHNNIVIVEMKEKEDGSKELVNWKALSGHKLTVLQVAWSPHKDELLLSTSSDRTARVWDVSAGACLSVCVSHGSHTLGASWVSLPSLPHAVLTGGADCCLRLWDYRQHTLQLYEQLKQETSTKHKKSEKKEKKSQPEEAQKCESNEQLATQLESVRKASKKYILPLIHNQINKCDVEDIKRTIRKYISNEPPASDGNTRDVDFVNMFGSINEINQILDAEMSNLLEANLLESWMTLSIFRGHIDTMIQFASHRDMLCPYLISMAPCVSFKYWKDVTQLYIAQVDRFTAKGEEYKLSANGYFGGALYRKVCMLLSAHEAPRAAHALADNHLYKEAYLLCRTRYMDSIAQDILRQWAKYSHYSGNVRMAAICHIVVGDLSAAATALSKFDDQETLSISAELAKMAGRDTFAEHVEKKAFNLPQHKDTTQEILEELPSRIELLMKDVKSNSPVNGVESKENNIEKEVEYEKENKGDIKV